MFITSGQAVNCSQTAAAPQPLNFRQSQVDLICTQCFAATTQETLFEFRRMTQLKSEVLTLVIDYLIPSEEQEIVQAVILRLVEGWKAQECTDEALCDLLIDKAKALFSNANLRKAAYKTDLKVLNNGFWYANEYFKFLSEKKQLKRLDALVKAGSFYHGRPPSGFTTVATTKDKSYTEVSLFHYVLMQGVSATDGLVNAKEGPVWFSDCQIVLEMAFYEVLLQVGGERRFNASFSAGGATPLTLCPNIGLTPLTRYLTQTIHPEKGKVGQRPILRGDASHFKNLPSYGIRHPQGESGGWHTLCLEALPVQIVGGFGLPSRGVSENELIEHFVREFNETPIEESSILPPHLLAQAKAKGGLKAHNTGLSEEEIRKRVNATVLTRDTFMRAELSHPNLVGFMPATLRLSRQAIQQALKSATATQTAGCNKVSIID